MIIFFFNFDLVSFSGDIPPPPPLNIDDLSSIPPPPSLSAGGDTGSLPPPPPVSAPVVTAKPTPPIFIFDVGAGGPVSANKAEPTFILPNIATPYQCFEVPLIYATNQHEFLNQLTDSFSHLKNCVTSSFQNLLIIICFYYVISDKRSYKL